MLARLSNPKNRLFLGHFIEHAAIGQPFPRSNWPLHISLVPWFLCGSPNILDESLSSMLSGICQFEVAVGGEAMFGSKKNIKVNLIEPSRQLLDLHKKLLAGVNTLGKLDTDEQFAGSGYRAHITHAKGRRKQQGEIIRVDSIHLAELIDSGHCAPIKRYGLRR
jgi:2'-5' RNA ligase